jgi:hypothetical protein
MQRLPALLLVWRAEIKDPENTTVSTAVTPVESLRASKMFVGPRLVHVL